MKVLVNVVKLIKIKALSFNTFSFYRGNAHNKLFQFVRFAHPLRLTKGGISKKQVGYYPFRAQAHLFHPNYDTRKAMTKLITLIGITHSFSC